MILTHAHSDHVGIAEGVRVDAPAPVYVHAADEQMARTGKIAPARGQHAPLPPAPGGLALPRVGRPRRRRRRRPRSRSSTTFTDGDLDVPGRPRVIPTPGHSPGHVSFHLPDRGVLIAGDALCTYNVAHRGSAARG